MTMQNIIISTDSVADIPEYLRNKYQISMMYYYVTTEYARFQDIMEMDADSLLDYIDTHKHIPVSGCASPEEYRKYFEKLLEEKPEGIIHLSMASASSGGYAAASEAAEDLDQVYVVDTEAISASIALLALYAVDLAKRGCPLKVILSAIEKKKKEVSCAFVLKDTEFLVRAGKLGNTWGKLVRMLSLHPVFVMKKGKIHLVRMFFGNERRYVKGYINYILRKSEEIDPSLLFVTMTGCSDELKEWIYQEAKKKVKWDEIIFQPTCASVSCNCGSGSFGLIFSKKTGLQR